MMFKLLARFLARPKVATWLIERSQRTPYVHLEGYMSRYWLFNAYPWPSDGRGPRFPFLPSIRIHHILRSDSGRHLHDHPWNARTFILRGRYTELREEKTFRDVQVCKFHFRVAGDTAALRFGEYHTITEVSDGGVWTLFCTWKWRGVWGYKVNGVKVPWRVYLNIPEKENETPSN